MIIFFILVLPHLASRSKSDENISQCLESNFDKILNTIHKIYIVLTCMIQGFHICIA